MLDKADTYDLKIDTLAGDVRDALIGHMRDLKRPWSLMTEAEQRDKIAAMEMAARHLVRQTVMLFTDFEFPRAVVTLGEVKIRGEKGIEAKIGCTNIEHNRTVLGEHVGDMVLMLMVDAETFMGERQPANPDPDQPELPGGVAD